MITLTKESNGYSVVTRARGEHLSLSPCYRRKTQALDNLRKQAQAWSDYFGVIYYRDEERNTVYQLNVSTGKRTKLKHKVRG